MSKNLGAKPLMVPQPVLIIGTYDENGKPNAMNAAWGGIVGMNEIIIDLGSHQTTDNIAKTQAFTVAMGEAEQVVPCDYVGIASGRTEPDKMEKAGFTTRRSEFVNAPVINELALTLECRLKKIVEGSMYIGEIVNVVADDRILTGGAVDMSKYRPIAFAPGGYYVIGEKVGEAFKDGNKLK